MDLNETERMLSAMERVAKSFESIATSLEKIAANQPLAISHHHYHPHDNQENN